VNARRVVVYRAADGWRYKVQGTNWRTIATSDRPRVRRAFAIAAAERAWPGVEVKVVDD
jgi:hypothetical protein